MGNKQMTYKQQVRLIFKKRMVELNISGKELANKIGVSEATIYRALDTSTKTPHFALIEKIGLELGLKTINIIE